MNNNVLAVKISSESYGPITSVIIEWARSVESRNVYAANVHMLMEAYDDPGFRNILNQADIVTSDGMPLVWVLRLKGVKKQERVYGPTLMLNVLEMAEAQGISVGFFGSSPDVVKTMVTRLKDKYPKLEINLICSPPFHTLSDKEEEFFQEQILQSGIHILFVGLGCPKQEKWIAAHKGKIPAVMIGVGAAFDFHAGILAQSPPLIQKIGMEWLFRLVHEPKRLWRRYLCNNPRFVFLAIADLLGLYNPK